VGRTVHPQPVSAPWEWVIDSGLVAQVADADAGRHEGHQSALRSNDVDLPPWVSTTEEFVRINRAALESDYITEHPPYPSVNTLSLSLSVGEGSNTAAAASAEAAASAYAFPAFPALLGPGQVLVSVERKVSHFEVLPRVPIARPLSHSHSHNHSHSSSPSTPLPSLPALPALPLPLPPPLLWCSDGRGCSARGGPHQRQYQSRSRLPRPQAPRGLSVC
jgi:hypothetical protein